MRASVMLHLPGLVMTGQIGPTIQGVNKLNLAVRGIFGEGTDNRGNLFQVSNQSTLGESESQIIERLNMVIRQLISHEKNARDVYKRQAGWRYAMFFRVNRGDSQGKACRFEGRQGRQPCGLPTLCATRPDLQSHLR